MRLFLSPLIVALIACMTAFILFSAIAGAADRKAPGTLTEALSPEDPHHALINCLGAHHGACFQALFVCSRLSYPDHEAALLCFEGFDSCVDDTGECFEKFEAAKAEAEGKS